MFLQLWMVRSLVVYFNAREHTFSQVALVRQVLEF
jgi:hypothetical protein